MNYNLEIVKLHVYLAQIALDADIGTAKIEHRAPLTCVVIWRSRARLLQQVRTEQRYVCYIGTTAVVVTLKPVLRRDWWSMV